MSASEDQFVGAHALCSLLYNMAPVDMVDYVFPGEAEGYRHEKAALCAQSQLRFIGQLDPSRFRRLVDLAVERYGANAARLANLY